MANDRKQTQLDSLIAFISDSKNFALVKYQSTSHQTLETLRRELKKSGVELRMLKNSLFEKAITKMSVKNTALKSFRKEAFPLKDNAGLLSLGEKWNEGLSVFYQFIQKEKSLTLRAGMLDHSVYKDSDMGRIAQLPGRDVLIAKTIGGMKSPLAHFHRALQFNMQKFVYILNAKAKSS